MVQCRGTNVDCEYHRCGNYGEPNVRRRFYCFYHLKCKGFTDEERQVRCGSRADPDCEGYCTAAHHPSYNFFKPSQFRVDYLPVNVSQLLRTYDYEDAYTGDTLKARRAQRDHVIECQIPAHVFNMLRKEYKDRGRRGAKELEHAISIVKEFVNDKMNLVPIDRYINMLKGAGVTHFLNKRTFLGNEASWTTSLLDAHEQMNCTEMKKMKKKRLSRDTTKAITGKVTRRLRRLARKLEDEYDNKTEEKLARRFKKLHVQIKES